MAAARPARGPLVEAPAAKLQQLAALRAHRDRLLRDRLARIDVFAVIGFEPLCKPRVLARAAGDPEHLLPAPCGRCPQERFLGLPDGDLDVLFGGAAGGGKSASLLAYAFRACARFAGLQAFWFRRSFPELNQSVLRMLTRYGYGKALGAQWNGSKYELSFPNGSILTFAHAKNVKEAGALSSAEINLLIIDERTTIDPDVVEFLYTRVRSGVLGVPCLGVRSASNPGHIGHASVKTGYVDATDYGANEIIDGSGRRRIFVPAKVSDNPYVGNYEEALHGITDPDLRRRMLDGDWSVMPDQAFPDWQRDSIVVPRFEIPPSWTRYAGMDWGWTAPTVVIWAARDNDGRLWVYRELTMTQTAEKETARRVLAAEAGAAAPVVRAADPSMWGKSSSALPVATQMAIEGLPLRQADNDRIGGKMRLHGYLAKGPACAYHRQLGWVVCPQLHVLDGAAPKLVETMPSLPRDPNRQEDVDTNADDHWYDAVRYLVQAVGAAPSMIFDDGPEPGDGVTTLGRYAFNGADLRRPVGDADRRYDDELDDEPPPQPRPAPFDVAYPGAVRSRPGDHQWTQV